MKTTLMIMILVCAACTLLLSGCATDQGETSYNNGPNAQDMMRAVQWKQQRDAYEQQQWNNATQNGTRPFPSARANQEYNQQRQQERNAAATDFMMQLLNK